MSDKVLGDLEIFGVVTIGSRTDGTSGVYTLPFDKGADGTVLGVAPAPSSTGLSGTMVQWIKAPQLVGGNGIEVIQTTGNQLIISLYVPLSASLSVSPNSFEIGQSITACNLSWSYNKDVVSQSLNNGIGSLPPLQRSYVYTTIVPITSNRSFTLTGNDGTNNASSTANINFNKRRYWGTIPASQNTFPTNAQILAGSSEFASNRNKSITYNCSTPVGGNYFYYCYPTSYGLSNVTVNGFPFSDWFDPNNLSEGMVLPTTIPVTSQYGYIENYYIYRVFNVQNGASIPVVYG